MKIYKSGLIFLCAFVIIYCSSSCERDDICAEDAPTTPLLIVKFVDILTGSDPKAPNELLIKPLDTIFKDSIYYSTNMDSIAIPLRTDVSNTDFVFTITVDTTAEGEKIINRDTLKFQYTPEEVYLSSACGFRASFNGLTFTPPSANDTDTWIKNITIETENVIDETTTHLLIFH